MLSPPRVARRSSDPCEELSGAERLGDVVVGTTVEAHEHVRLVTPRGEDEDRGPVASGPELGEERQAVDVGEGEIEHDEVGLAVLKGAARGAAVGRDLHVVPLELQRRPKAERQIVVVFNQQYVRQREDSRPGRGSAPSDAVRDP